MAEFIRFRFSAAKASVTMAFLALLGGLTAKAAAERSQHDVQAREAKTISWSPKLTLNGLSGNLKTALITVQKDLANVYYKEQKDIASVLYKEHKDIVSVLYKEHKDFSALTNTLDANFFNKDQASATFLTQADATKIYQKQDQPATNSLELGGMSANQFIRGTGGVSTHVLTISGNSPSQNLITAPGTNGEIIVVCAPAPGSANGVIVTLHNGTSMDLSAVISQGASLKPTPVPAGMDTLLGTFTSGAGQLQVQMFPATPSTGANQVFTLTVSSELSGNNTLVVGQMVNGDG
jgi:hypothetical protein